MMISVSEDKQFPPDWETAPKTVLGPLPHPSPKPKPPAK